VFCAGSAVFALFSPVSHCFRAVEIRTTVSYRRAASSRRRSRSRARAAAFALASATIATAAHAQLVYDTFNYTAGTTLDGKVNPGSGLPWAGISADVSDDEILVSGSNLTYSPSFAGSIGGGVGSVTYGGTGKSERLALGPVIGSGTLYYSLVLNVTSVGGMTAAPVFVAGFNNRTGTNDVQPTTVGTRLYLRQSVASTPQNPRFLVGVSKNSSNVADILFEDDIVQNQHDLSSPLLIVGSYEINPAGGQDDVSRIWVNPTPGTWGAAAAPTATRTAPITGTDLLDETFTNPALSSFLLRQAVSSVPGVQVDDLRIDQTWAQVTPPAGVSWNADADGNWSSGGNWTGGVLPNSPDAFVNLPAVISAPRAVLIDTPVSVRTLNFTSPGNYALTGAQPINFSTSAAINVTAGIHGISAPITLGGDLLLSVASGAAFAVVSDLNAPAATITKAGAGVLVIKNADIDTLNLFGGVVQVNANGTATGMTRLRKLNLTPGAILNLRDNDLIVREGAVGSLAGSTYTGITGLIQSGRNGGSWTSSGIVSTSAIGGNFTSLGVATASQVKGINPADTATWNGQMVTGTDTLVMYTYGGDANLDGKINVDDYGRIDFNINLGTSGWYNGDFNYDGKVNVDDYGIIDFNVGIQGAPLGSSTSVAAVSAVPEPLVLAPLAMVGLLVRRRRIRVFAKTCSDAGV
jgi:hypothetical protein